MGCVRIAEQKLLVTLYGIPLLVFITRKECVDCAVRCDSLNARIIQGNVGM
jgi:hypothetical protein